jgi:hypothetical protein
VEARQKVAKGDVAKTMGQTMETAIGVTATAQQYEFLRLFEVEPLTHRKLDMHPVEMWQCVDRQGAPVVYYFNHSQAYRWAFARTAAVHSPAGGHMSPSPGQAISVTTAEKTSAVSVGGGPMPPANQKTGRIWESKIFK